MVRECLCKRWIPWCKSKIRLTFIMNREVLNHNRLRWHYSAEEMVYLDKKKMKSNGFRLVRIWYLRTSRSMFIQYPLMSTWSRLSEEIKLGKIKLRYPGLFLLPSTISILVYQSLLSNHLCNNNNSSSYRTKMIDLWKLFRIRIEEYSRENSMSLTRLTALERNKRLLIIYREMPDHQFMNS